MAKKQDKLAEWMNDHAGEQVQVAYTCDDGREDRFCTAADPYKNHDGQWINVTGKADPLPFDRVRVVEQEELDAEFNALFPLKSEVVYMCNGSSEWVEGLIVKQMILGTGYVLCGNERMGFATDQIRNPKIETQKGQRQLQVALTEEEKLSAGRRMADAMSRVDDLGDELKRYKTQNKADTEAAQGEAGAAAERIRTGYEVRTVDVETRINYYTATARVIRMDSDDQIEERPLRDDERQRGLDIVIPPPEPDPEPVEDPTPEGELPLDDQGADDPGGEIAEPELLDALRVIQETGRAGAAMLTRRMKIKASRAHALLNAMEGQGWLGAARGSEPREILIDPAAMVEAMELS